MPVALAAAAFLAGAMISLATSWLLVSRLERVGERLGLSEALLGLVAALAADAPEVTAAITAMAGRQPRLGAGVVIGSNVFNLAALLGLGAVVAGRVRLHRRVVVLGGTVAMCVAAACLAVVTGLVPAAAGLVVAVAAMALYAAVLGMSAQRLARLPLPGAWTSWLGPAVAEEEQELEDAIRPPRARRRDAIAAIAALLVVVAASVMMERAAAALGSRFAIPDIVVGGLVLAAVTSLPNAVAAVYLAGRGRGAATLSTALNSNALNVTIGLLIPAAVTGLGRPSGQAALIAAWYTGLTAAVLVFAYRDRGIGRAVGILVIAALPCLRRIPAGGRVHALASVPGRRPGRRRAGRCVRRAAGGRPAGPLPGPAPQWPPARTAGPRTRAAPARRGGGVPAAWLAGPAAVDPRPDPAAHRGRRRCCPRCPGDPDRAAHHRTMLRAADRTVGTDRADRVVGHRPGGDAGHTRRHLGNRHPAGLPRRGSRGGGRLHGRRRPHRGTQALAPLAAATAK